MCASFFSFPWGLEAEAAAEPFKKLLAGRSGLRRFISLVLELTQILPEPQTLRTLVCCPCNT